MSGVNYKYEFSFQTRYMDRRNMSDYIDFKVCKTKNELFAQEKHNN